MSVFCGQLLVLTGALPSKAWPEVAQAVTVTGYSSQEPADYLRLTSQSVRSEVIIEARDRDFPAEVHGDTYLKSKITEVDEMCTRLYNYGTTVAGLVVCSRPVESARTRILWSLLNLQADR
jgi:hypothetical protein